MNLQLVLRIVERGLTFLFKNFRDEIQAYIFTRIEGAGLDQTVATALERLVSDLFPLLIKAMEETQEANKK